MLTRVIDEFRQLLARSSRFPALLFGLSVSLQSCISFFFPWQRVDVPQSWSTKTTPSSVISQSTA